MGSNDHPIKTNKIQYLYRFKTRCFCLNAHYKVPTRKTKCDLRTQTPRDRDFRLSSETYIKIIYDKPKLLCHAASKCYYMTIRRSEIILHVQNYITTLGDTSHTENIKWRTGTYTNIYYLHRVLNKQMYCYHASIVYKPQPVRCQEIVWMVAKPCWFKHGIRNARPTPLPYFNYWTLRISYEFL